MRAFDDITEWLSWKTPKGLRYGQHRMTSAPLPISRAATDEPGFDCWESDNRDDPVVRNFIMLVILCWEITDENEIEKAMNLIREK